MEVFKVSQELAGASCEFVAAARSMMHDAFRHLGTSRGSSQIFAYKRTKLKTKKQQLQQQQQQQKSSVDF